MPEEDSEIASSEIAALIALVCIGYAIWAVNTGQVKSEASIIYLLSVAAVGGLVQFTTGIIELKRGDTFGGNLFLYFGSFFMFLMMLKIIFTFWGHVGLGLPYDATIEGWVWLVLTVSLIGWTPGFAYRNSIFFTAIGAFDISLFLTAVTYLGIIGEIGHEIAGWGFFIGCTLLLYFAFATLVNIGTEKQVLPTGSPLLE